MIYIIGNLIGRFAASYLLVFIVNLFTSRLRPRDALRKTHTLWGWFVVVLVFFLGLIGHFV